MYLCKSDQNSSTDSGDYEHISCFIVKIWQHLEYCDLDNEVKATKILHFWACPTDISVYVYKFDENLLTGSKGIVHKKLHTKRIQSEYVAFQLW